MKKKQKFYNTSWFMWFALILFTPLGIFLMWKNKRYNKRLRIILSVFGGFIVVSFFMSINNPTDQVNEQVIMTCNNQIENNVEQNQLVESAEYSLVSVKSGNTIEDIQVLAVANSDVQSVIEGDLKVHYIDVGQADSILIQQNGYNMLIDGGNNEDSDLVINYLKQQGVTKLDYVIGTHPHEDHIGGLDVAIKSFDIGKVILPKVTSTTQTFEDVVNAIADKGLKIITPVVGDTYELGSAQWCILYIMFSPNDN
jgi:beta-lactamase superfamily II metal-dependent hydrolase